MTYKVNPEPPDKDVNNKLDPEPPDKGMKYKVNPGPSDKEMNNKVNPGPPDKEMNNKISSISSSELAHSSVINSQPLSPINVITDFNGITHAMTIPYRRPSTDSTATADSDYGKIYFLTLRANL